MSKWQSRSMRRQSRVRAALAAVAQQQTPSFSHDCSRCRYMGSFLVDGTLRVDAYWCDSEWSRWPTLLVRFNDEGDKYVSSDLTAREKRHYHTNAKSLLGIALRMAVRLGLTSWRGMETQLLMHERIWRRYQRRKKAERAEQLKGAES